MLLRYSSDPSLAQRLERAVVEPPGQASHTPAPPFTQYKIAHRISAVDVGALIAAYQSGEDTPRLAQRYGISKSAVKRLLHAHDVKLRRQSMGSRDVTRAAELRANGATLEGIAQECGYSVSTIMRALKSSRGGCSQ